MDNKNDEPICAHAVIGVVTTLLESGMIDPFPCSTGTWAVNCRGLPGFRRTVCDGNMIGNRITGIVIAEMQVGSGSEVCPAAFHAAAGSAYIT
jgi:hypothetical protein